MYISACLQKEPVPAVPALHSPENPVLFPVQLPSFFFFYACPYFTVFFSAVDSQWSFIAFLLNYLHFLNHRTFSSRTTCDGIIILTKYKSALGNCHFLLVLCIYSESLSSRPLPPAHRVPVPFSLAPALSETVHGWHTSLPVGCRQKGAFLTVFVPILCCQRGWILLWSSNNAAKETGGYQPGLSEAAPIFGVDRQKRKAEKAGEQVSGAYTSKRTGRKERRNIVHHFLEVAGMIFLVNRQYENEEEETNKKNDRKN